jgi:hypothetical protein
MWLTLSRIVGAHTQILVLRRGLQQFDCDPLRPCQCPATRTAFGDRLYEVVTSQATGQVPGSMGLSGRLVTHELLDIGFSYSSRASAQALQSKRGAQ